VVDQGKECSDGIGAYRAISWPAEHDLPGVPVEWNDELAFEEEFISLPESVAFSRSPKWGKGQREGLHNESRGE